MVSIDNVLKSFYFSRNQVPVRLACPEKFEQGAVLAKVGCLFGEDPTDGDTLTIGWTDGDLEFSGVFTFRAVPDAGLYEIGLVGADSPAVWLANTVMPGLLANPDVAAYFALSYTLGPPTLWFTAVEAKELNPTLAVVGFPGGQTGVVNGAAAVMKENYRASMWLAIGKDADGTAYDKIGELELDPDNDGMVKVDLQNYVEAYLTGSETPTNVVDDLVKCNTIVRPAYVLAGEKWGDPIVRQKGIVSAPFKIFKGGLTPQDFALFGTNGTISNSQFLTNRLQRNSTKAQKDWVYWYCRSGMGSDAMGPLLLGLQYKLYYTDGTSSSSWVWHSKTPVVGELYQIAIGYDALGMDALANPSKTVYKVEYWLAKQGGEVANVFEVSNKLTVMLRDADYLHSVFEYENSICGGVESWIFKAERVLNSTLQKQVYRKDLPFEYGVSDTELHSYNEQHRPVINCNTGSLSRDEAYFLLEFVQSGNVWLRVGDHRLKVRISTKDINQDSINGMGNYVRSFDFSAELGPSKGVSNRLKIF